MLEIKYEECIGKNRINENQNDSSVKILVIDFCYNAIDDINTVIENIDNYLTNKNNIEILSFINYKLSDKISLDTFGLNNSQKFPNLQNIKEFFINNNSNIPIVNLSPLQLLKIKIRKDNKFIYMGYDTNNNLIYYRVGSSQIQSIDILDLFNIFNQNIIKLSLICENIDIIYNKKQNVFKIR